MKPRTKKASRKRPQSASKTPEKIQLTLESVAFGGDALARLDGKVYFVADAIPGETVEAEVLQDKERFAKARVLRRLQPAPDAIPAPCPFADRCGGCQWQTVPYSTQLRWKSGFIHDALQRIGGIPADSYSFIMQGSIEPLFYRNRIEVKWQVLPEGSVRFGYFARSSHELVAIDRCLIADPRLNQVLKACTHLRFPPRERLFTTNLELQTMDDGRVLVSSADEAPLFWQDFQAAVNDDAWLSQQLILQDPRFFLLETDQGLRFHTRAGQFQQVNLPTNRFLRRWVRDFAGQESSQNIVDLYCGSGNLSLGLAQDGHRVWGVEAYGPSIEAAQHNVRDNGLEAHYAVGDALDIRKLFPELPVPDLLIVDPPRRGLAEAITPVLALEAKRVLYVSCDPNTLARDLKQFLAQGYSLRQVMGLDFFPQSYHVESVCVLTRN